MPVSILPAERIRRLPPYLFAEIDRMKKEVAARGVDLISLGIGSSLLIAFFLAAHALARGLGEGGMTALVEATRDQDGALDTEANQRVLATRPGYREFGEAKRLSRTGIAQENATAAVGNKHGPIERVQKPTDKARWKGEKSTLVRPCGRRDGSSH